MKTRHKNALQGLKGEAFAIECTFGRSVSMTLLHMAELI